jgi:hypothetical protein
MTTIIGDWKNKILVADSQFTDDETGIKYYEDKIIAIDGGWLGVAGNWVDGEKVVEYLSKKTNDGLFACGDDLEWERVRTFMAIGSGAMAAEVCMRMGLTAEESVKWACNVDAKSHEPIKTYNL